MKVTYQSKNYSPELVTGFYVRCMGQKPNYVFKVIESETCKRSGKPGQGYTLREWETNGEELPQELKQRCIRSKTTELWKKEEEVAKPGVCSICHGTGYDKGTRCICAD